MNSRFASAFLFFAATMAVGIYAGSRSWNGVIHITAGTLFDTNRGPAAIRKELDFSRLDGAELLSATQKRLVTAARVLVMEDGDVGVELGHFVTRDEEGKRRLACDSAYNRVNLRFAAEGVATAGEKTVMEIDAPCRTNFDDINAISAITIPVKKLMAEKPVDMDLAYEDDVKFKFTHLSSRWPLRWSLQSVRLYNSTETAKEVSITSSELRKLRPKPFMVFWTDAVRVPTSETTK